MSKRLVFKDIDSIRSYVHPKRGHEKELYIYRTEREKAHTEIAVLCNLLSLERLKEVLLVKESTESNEVRKRIYRFVANRIEA